MAKWRNRLLLIGMESVYGTAPALVGADALLCKEIDISPLEVELYDRELITGYFGNTEKVLISQMSKVTVTVEYAASGTAGTPPKWGPLMRAAGNSQTIVPTTSVEYLPISSAPESAAMMFYADGVRHTLRGSRGEWGLAGEVDGVPLLSFEYIALYTPATATANPTATYTAQAKPLVMNSANTPTVDVHGFAACMESFSLNMANDVTFRHLAGCSERVELNDRKPSGSIKIEAPTLAAKDYFAAVSAQDLGAIDWTHGTTAGNILTLSQPSCNLGTPAYSNSNGTIMLELPFMPNPVSGNDEYSLLLT